MYYAERLPDSGAKPYDQIMYRPVYTSNEFESQFDMVILYLVKLMKPYWVVPGPYPGDPHNHNLFGQYYSDHDPVLFRLKTCIDDD